MTKKVCHKTLLQQAIEDWDEMTISAKKNRLFQVIKGLEDQTNEIEELDGRLSPASQIEFIKSMYVETSERMDKMQISLETQGKCIKDLKKENIMLKSSVLSIQEELNEEKQTKIEETAAALAADMIYIYQKFKNVNNVEDLFGSDSFESKVALSIKYNRLESSHPGKKRDFKTMKLNKIMDFIKMHYPNVHGRSDIINLIEYIDTELQKNNVYKPFQLW